MTSLIGEIWLMKLKGSKEIIKLSDSPMFLKGTKEY